MARFQGTITALVTPFTDGAVDYDTLAALVERQIGAGVDGIVPCGTTGESPTLTKPEHDEVVARVSKLAKGRTQVIAGAGSNSTTEAVRLARHAQDAGAGGVLVVNPYYNKPNQRGLYAHFSAVAKAVEIPIVLYNIPGRTGVELSVETIRRLFDDHGNIVAVKHATGSVGGAAELISRCAIDVLSGDDPVTWPLMSLGAIGVISVMSNLMPKAVKRLTDAALAGDMAAARDAHRALYPLATALLSLDTNPMPIKTAMALRGLCREEFRLPMCALDDGRRAELEKLLKGVED